MTDIGLEIAKLLVAVVGGVFIAWYWNYRKHRLEQYRYLDEIYHDLLRLYRENPQFGNGDRASNYSVAWEGEEALRYHHFAMTVHSVMESIYDLYGTGIPDEWIHIFRHHTRLHSAWLDNNRSANRPGYVEYIVNRGLPGGEV